MVQDVNSVEYNTLTVDDIVDMRELILGFGEASQMLRIFETKMDMDHFERTVSQLFAFGMASGIIAKVDGKIIGVFLYSKSPNVFSAEMTAQEMIWFVLPDYRDKSVGARLYSRATKQAKDQGCVYMAMIHLETSMPSELRAFYNRQGYTHMESNFQKRL